MPDDAPPQDDAGWELLAHDWWRTPLSLAPAPLSWIDRAPRKTRPRTRPEIAARNSHYWHDVLLRVVQALPGAEVCCDTCHEWRYGGSERGLACDAGRETGLPDGQELALNVELVGVRMVLALVGQLERAVGIAAPGRHRAAGEIATLARRVSLLLGDYVPDVDPQESWQEYTASVLDGHRIAPPDAALFRPDLYADPPARESITPILDLDLDPPRRKRGDPAREVIDLTDSEQSVESEAPPATPKPTRTYAVDVGGSMAGDLPRLHIPRVPSSPSISYSSGSPPTSDELRSEYAHTRCSSLPPGGDLHKDDPDPDPYHDLDLTSESTPSEDADSIPHFLVTPLDRPLRQHSRTRELIDRMRGAAIAAPRGRTKTPAAHDGAGAPPAKPRRGGLNHQAVQQLFQKGSDGWIRLADDAEPASAPAPDDSDPSDAEGPAPRAAKKKGGVAGRHARRAPAAGWIDGGSPPPPPPVQQQSQSHPQPAPRRGHRPAQSAQLAAPASVGTFTFPPPTPAPAFFPFAHALPGGVYAPPLPPSLVPFAPPPPPPYRAYYPPPPPLLPAFGGAFARPPAHAQGQGQGHAAHGHSHSQSHGRPAYANGPVITGSAGIRHAQW